MSKIAKNSIKFSKEINCSFENGILIAKGKLGEFNQEFHPASNISIKDSKVLVTRTSN